MQENEILNSKNVLTEWSFEPVEYLYYWKIRNLENWQICEIYELRSNPTPKTVKFDYQITIFHVGNESEAIQKSQHLISSSYLSSVFKIENSIEDAKKFAEDILKQLGYVKLNQKLLNLI